MSSQYDDYYGRPKSLTYPNQLTVGFTYSSNGYLLTEENAESGYVYKKVNQLDKWGNAVAFETANGRVNSQLHFSSNTGQMLSSRASRGSTNIHYLNYSDYDSYGNIISQENVLPNLNASENFVYDELQRLEQSTVYTLNQSLSISYAYDEVGNLRKKTDYSINSNNAYQYLSGTNKVNTVSLAGGGTESFAYDNNGNLTHRNGVHESYYNVHNKPISITKGNVSSAFSYGADLLRYKQVSNVSGVSTTTHYIDKLFEVETKNNQKIFKAYISDSAVIVESEGDTTIRFMYRDRLGSAASFADHNGMPTAYRSYDPFGKPKGGDWSTLPFAVFSANSYDTEQVTSRGFTDHEHLDELQLIHMNGRVYDYNVGRFMSVDPFIQAPGNSQSINPYSYIMNNPMAGTDPSGYLKVCDTFIVCSEDQVKDDYFNKQMFFGGGSASQSSGADGEDGQKTENDSSKIGAVTDGEISTNVGGGDSSTVSDGGTPMTPNYRGATAEFTDITTNDEGVVTNATITCNLSCQDESREILRGRDLAKADLSMTMMRMNMQNAHSQASEALMWVFSPVGATYGGFALRGGYQATAVGLKNLGSAKRNALFAFNVEISSILNGMFHPANIMKSMVPHSQVIQSASFRYGASASNVLGKPRIRRFIKGPGKPKIRPENMGN